MGRERHEDVEARIDAEEIAEWAERLNVTPEELRSAVQRGGDMVKDVMAELRRRTYYIDLPPDVAARAWLDFERTLSFPGAGLEARFAPADGETKRCRVDLSGASADAARIDKAMFDFRVFLEGRGLLELTRPADDSDDVSREGSRAK